MIDLVSNMLYLHLEALGQDPDASGPDLCGNRIKFHSVPEPGNVCYRDKISTTVPNDSGIRYRMKLYPISTWFRSRRIKILA
jgi:hypothetical protein